MNNEKVKKRNNQNKINRLREKREICFAILFEMTFTDDPIDVIIENAKQSKIIENKLSDNDSDKQPETDIPAENDMVKQAKENILPYNDKFIMNVLDSFVQNKDEIDDIIKSNIKGWTIDRLSRVTLSVLRFAVTELKYGNVSEKIIINEAVELSKKYSTPGDARFVNGVLGSVVRKTEE